MELPILYALTHPERVADGGVRRFDPVAVGSLTFEAVDRARYPAFGLGLAAGRTGGTAPAVFNASNEVAVGSFLDGRLRFVEIPGVIEKTLEACGSYPSDSLDAVKSADREARERARGLIEELQ
jgi:1-deoxy-D-xylulose-5-phosphate reductoisomerase